MIADEAMTQRHGTTSKRLPSASDAKIQLDMELEEIMPQALPRQDLGNQTPVRFAMDGQAPAFATMEIKNATVKKNDLDMMPNIPVVNIQRLREKRNTLRPPNRSAMIPVTSFPVIVPAVPQPRIAPHAVLSSSSVGSSSMAGLAMMTVARQMLTTA